MSNNRICNLDRCVVPMAIGAVLSGVITATALPQSVTETSNEARRGLSEVELKRETYTPARAIPQFAIIELSRGDIFDQTVRASNQMGSHIGAAVVVDDPYVFVPVVWDAFGQMSLLKLPSGYPGAVGWALNDFGEAAGERSGQPSLFWDAAGDVFQMDDLGSGRVEVMGLSNLGQVVGVARTAQGVSHAYVWSLQSGMIDLGDLNPDEEVTSIAYDINDDGVIVGWSYERPGYFLGIPVVWIDNEIQRLPGAVPPALALEARSINNAGVILGRGSERDKGVGPVIWPSINDTAVSLLDPYSKMDVEPVAINNNNIVLGDGERNGAKPLIWYDWNEYPIKLKDQLPRNSPWTIWATQCLNDHNQIGGLAFHNGRDTGFIATPVYPTIIMNEPVPGRAGEINTITLSNLTPNATVQVLVGTHGGGTIIPGCSMLQNVLQIDNPKLVATAVADSNGIATVSGLIPTSRRWQTLLFQAVVRDTCEISNLVVQTFE